MSNQIIYRLNLSFVNEYRDVIVDGVSFEEAFRTQFGDDPMFISDFFKLPEDISTEQCVSDFQRLIHTVNMFSEFLKFDSFVKDEVNQLLSIAILLEGLAKYKKDYDEISSFIKKLPCLPDAIAKYKKICDRYEELKQKGVIDFELPVCPLLCHTKENQKKRPVSEAITSMNKVFITADATTTADAANVTKKGTKKKILFSNKRLLPDSDV